MLSLIRMMESLRYEVVAASILSILSVQLVLGRTRKTPLTSTVSMGRSLQVQRRLQHILSGLIVLYFQRYSRASEFILFLSISTLAILFIHFSRLHSSFIQEHFIHHFRYILRDSEMRGMRVPGALYFLIGDIIAFFLYPKNFCSLVILSVTFGDPTAGIVGTLFESRKLIGNKSFAGTIGCAIVSGFVLTFAAHIFGIIPSDFSSYFIAFGLLGTISAVSEMLAVLDDNLTMPILFGAIFRILIAFSDFIPKVIAELAIMLFYAL